MKCFQCHCEYFRQSSMHLCPTCDAEARLDLPTPEEIREAAAEIRAGWSKTQERIHRGEAYGKQYEIPGSDGVPEATPTDHVTMLDCY